VGAVALTLLTRAECPAPLYCLHLTLRGRGIRGNVSPRPFLFLPLFTQVPRRRCVLGSPYPASCIAPPAIERGLRSASLVQAHLTSRLCGRSLLHRREGVLQPELEPLVVGVAQPGIGFTLEGGELPGYVCELSGEGFLAEPRPLNLLNLDFFAVNNVPLACC
jgi:hypothetical protein